MTISEKLQLIQRLSGLSQEKLAQKLGVSFVTLNRWLNGKATPRQKAEERIDALYRSTTGQKIIPEDALAAKIQMIEKKRPQNILKTILQNRDLYDQLMLSLTYNTNRIEGNSLTEAETAAILFQSAALPDKTLIEQMEAKNHQAALDYLLNTLTHTKKIDEPFILKLHSILMNGIRSDAGLYRHHAVRIVGANVPTANYLKVPSLMTDLTKKIAHPTKHTIHHVTQTHSNFEKIHPFADGNGRIGRLLIQAMLLRKNLPPALIQQEKRQFYMASLQTAQQKDDLSPLEDFICDAVLAGFQLVGSP